MTQIIIVTATFHAAESKWSATAPDLAGLFLVADSWSDLTERLPAAVHERLSRSTTRYRGEFSIEVLLHATLRITIEAPARYHSGVSAGVRPARDASPVSPRWGELSIHNAA